MSILSPQVVEKPEQEILNAKAAHLKRVTVNAYNNIINIQVNGIKTLWNDPTFTPQQIIDALGPDALKIFQMHGILTDAINQIAAIDGITPAIALPTNAFEVVDGSIVVSEDPYV